jgi:hypothetical protein
MILLLAQAVALQGATVHTMIPGEEPRIATVISEEGRFLAIGEELEVPEGAQVVDASGLHLVPGLIDGMVHHDMDHDPLYVLNGVTLCRDMGNDLETILIAALPNIRNRMPGPDLLVAGAIFDGVPPATTEAIIVRTPEEVQEKLPRLIERGIQFASYHQGIPPAAWRALITAAHDEGIQVWGPIPNGVDPDTARDAGLDGIAYLEGFRQAGAEWDTELAHEQVLAFATSGVANMPLLHVYAYRTVDQGDDPPIFNYLAPSYADWWRGDLEGRRAKFDEEYLADGARRYQQLESLVLDLWKSGAALVPGSAAPNPWMAPGSGLLDELDTWVEAGIPADEVLRMATSGAALACGVEADFGTIAAGKVANAVLLAHDPREDLATFRSPRGILLRGNWLDETYLEDLRGAMRDAQLEATLEAEKPLEVIKPQLPEGRVVLEGRVEGLAFDRVVAAEEYWVVRCFDGSTAWVGRMSLPGGVGSASTTTTISQRFVDEKLSEFQLEIFNGGISYRVEGLQTGGQFRLKRWLNDQYVDTNSTPRRPNLVDAGMSLPAMILSHYIADGETTALYFEGMDPIIVDWELKRNEKDVLAVRTGKGPMVATFEENGALAKLVRSQGKATVRYESARETSFGGPGMPPMNTRPGRAETARESEQPAPEDGQ